MIYSLLQQGNKLIELLDYDGFVNQSDGYSAIAIEKVTDPSKGADYLGNFILLAYDQYYNDFVGFMFDEYGNYLADIGSPTSSQLSDEEYHKAVNDAEELFGIDINDDGVKGRNVTN